MRTLLVGAGVLCFLSGCEGATDPELALPVSKLVTTIEISARNISRAHPPDRLRVLVKITNPYAVRLRIEPESSRVSAGDAFNGEGIRFSFRTTRADQTGGLGSYSGMYPDDVVLEPYGWFEIPYVVGVLEVAPANWDGEFVVYSTLQGKPLPLVSFRVGP